jgi:hypothetical protein
LVLNYGIEEQERKCPSSTGRAGKKKLEKKKLKNNNKGKGRGETK